MTGVLTPDKIRTESIGQYGSIIINEKIIPDNLVASKKVCSWIDKGGKMKPCRSLNDGKGLPRGITIHNTEKITLTKNATSMAEQYTRATLNENMSGVVVHFYVDKDSIWQNLKESERGWHAADGTSRRVGNVGATYSSLGGNVDTIAIECIGNNSVSEDTTAKLTAYLLKKYCLTVKDVYQHNYFYPSKDCPTYIRPHWSNFLKNVEKYYDAIEIKRTSANTDNSLNTTSNLNIKNNKTSHIKVKVKLKEGLNIRSNPSIISKKVGHLNFGDIVEIKEKNKNNSWGKINSGWICITNKYVKYL